jgi:hypothetical protein
MSRSKRHLVRVVDGGKQDVSKKLEAQHGAQLQTAPLNPVELEEGTLDSARWAKCNIDEK